MRTLIRTLSLATLFALPLATLPATAQCDGSEDGRAKVEEYINAGLSADKIAEILGDCAAKGLTAGDLEAVTANQNTTPTGSIFWEQIDACGYHPQRRELDCAVEVRQRFGFAGTPPGGPGFNGPGSWEWIQFCVDYGAGLVPVNLSAVHVHDEPFGVQPSWYYGVSVQADPTLHTALVNGQTLRARAILSWTLIPTGCNYNPIWGNQADFRIKLDP